LIGLCGFFPLQVTVALTAGRERKGRKNSSRSTCFFSFSDEGTWNHAPPLFLYFPSFLALFPCLHQPFLSILNLWKVYFGIWMIFNGFFLLIIEFGWFVKM
jgi:hypothetical protein